MKNRVAVLGSNSFSGSHFIAHCMSNGYQVAGISRSKEISSVFLPYSRENLNKFTFAQFDINHHIPEIISFLNDFGPDYVVNFAAQSMVGESWTNPDHWFQTNTVSTIKLHDKLRKCSYLKKYIHISTPEVYGNCTGMIRENTIYSPSSPYAVSRAAADMSLMSFYQTYNFPVIFTRAANVYGPGQQLYRIIPRTILYFLTGRKLNLHGGGHSIRSFIHIKDVVNGTLLACENASPGNIFHFSSHEIISIRDLIIKIADIMNISFNKNVIVTDDRLGKDSAYQLDSGKAESELKWNADIDLDTGIRETISWVEENIDLLLREPDIYIHKP